MSNYAESCPSHVQNHVCTTMSNHQNAPLNLLCYSTSINHENNNNSCTKWPIKPYAQTSSQDQQYPSSHCNDQELDATMLQFHDRCIHNKLSLHTFSVHQSHAQSIICTKPTNTRCMHHHQTLIASHAYSLQHYHNHHPNHLESKLHPLSHAKVCAMQHHKQDTAAA